MDVDGLMDYVLRNNVGQSVNLSNLAKDINEYTCKKPTILCDFFHVVPKFWKTPTRLLAYDSQYPFFARLTGPNFHLIASRAQRFVKALRSNGLKPIFFISSVPEFGFNPNSIDQLYRAHHTESVCKKKVPLNDTSEFFRCHLGLCRAQILTALEAVGAEIVFCDGDARKHIVCYAQMHEETCGIISNGSKFAITTGCVLFPIARLHKLLDKVQIVKKPRPILCQAVFPACIANALGIQENQLPELSVLCGNIFTNSLIKRLSVLSNLDIGGSEVEDIAEWLCKNNCSLLIHKSMQDMCQNSPDLLDAIKQSFSTYSLQSSLQEDEVSPDFKYASPVFDLVKQEMMKEKVIVSVAKQALYYMPILCEDFTLGKPCLEEILRPFRKVLYFLLGVKMVREYGRAHGQGQNMTTVDGCTSPQEESIGIKCLLKTRGFSNESKLVALYKLTITPLASANDMSELLNEVQKVNIDLPNRPWPELFRAAFLSCSLKFITQVDKVSQRQLALSQNDLDSLLVTCLTCAAEGRISPFKVNIIPSIRSIAISEWFSQIICWINTMACAVGLTEALPEPKNIFYPMAFVPYYFALHVSKIFSEKRETRIQRIKTTVSNILSLPAVKEFRSVIYSTEEPQQPLFHLTVLCQNALDEVSKNRDQLIQRAPAESEEESDEQSEEESNKEAAEESNEGSEEKSCEANSTEAKEYNGHQVQNSEQNKTELTKRIQKREYSESESSEKDETDLSKDLWFTREKSEESNSESESDSESEVSSLFTTDESSSSDSSSCTDSGSEDTEEEEDEEERVVSKPMYSSRNGELPIMEHEEQILKLISDFRVVFVEGETGCGKSSKVPQFVINQSESFKVIVGQPNLLAAKKLAERVANEREEGVGEVVGYCDELEDCTGTARLIYCTNSFLLQTLLQMDGSCSYTHIVLDEVHYRSSDIDFAMLIAQKLALRNPRLKVIVMSATLQEHLFLDYFRQALGSELVADPYSIDVRCHPVHVYFLDDLDQLLSKKHDPIQRMSMRHIAEELLRLEEDPLCFSEKPDVNPFTQNLCIDLIISQTNPGESVLVFVPSLGDIIDLYHNLENVFKKRCIMHRYHLFALHSQIPIEEQGRAFRRPERRTANIIISNKMAESTFTFPTLKLVINFGVTKEMVYNAITHKSVLNTVWCSVASFTQREGRVGRVSEGKAIHLVTKKLYKKLPKFNLPQILSRPLEKTVLKAIHICKEFGVELPSHLLGQIIEPPSFLQFKAALHGLFKNGAIECDPNSKVLEKAKLTSLGKFCLQLPLDFLQCRLVFLGLILGCPLDAVVMASSLSMYTDIFTLPTQIIMKDPVEFSRALSRSTFTRFKSDSGCLSNVLMVRNMFIEWLDMRATSDLSRRDAAVKFSRNNAIRFTRLLHFESLVGDMARALSSMFSSSSELFMELSTLSDIDRKKGGKPTFCDTDHFSDIGSAEEISPVASYIPPHLRKLRVSSVNSANLHFCQDISILKAVITASYPDSIMCSERICDSTTDIKKRRIAKKCIDIYHQEGFSPSNTLAMVSRSRDFCDENFDDLFEHLPISRDVYYDVETTINSDIAILHFKSSRKVSRNLNCIAQDVDYSSDDKLVNGHDELLELSSEVEIFWRFSEQRTLKIDSVNHYFPQSFHPYALQWYMLDRNKSTVITERTGYRNPTGLICCSVSPSDPILGVALSSYISSGNTMASNITVLPPFPQGLLIALAFQLPTSDVQLLIDRTNKSVHGLKINQCKIPSENIAQYITTEQLAEMNLLREAISSAMASEYRGKFLSLSSTHLQNVNKHVRRLLHTRSNPDTESQPTPAAASTSSQDSTEDVSLVWEKILPGKQLHKVNVASKQAECAATLSSNSVPYSKFNCSLLGLEPYRTTTLPIISASSTTVSVAPVEYTPSISEKLIMDASADRYRLQHSDRRLCIVDLCYQSSASDEEED